MLDVRATKLQQALKTDIYIYIFMKTIIKSLSYSYTFPKCVL